MIKVENIEVWGFEHAIRGMRNPMNSWAKMDSYIDFDGVEYDLEYRDSIPGNLVIGPNDIDLMKRLFNGGSEHRKYLRQIFVSMDVIAPDYWFKEFSTYRIGVTENSTSTMHKIHAKEFTLDDFSHEHLLPNTLGVGGTTFVKHGLRMLEDVVFILNAYRDDYLKTKDKRYWWQMIQLLPMSYNYRRTVTMNYENVVNMIHQREFHKLDEWREFVEILKGLPYISEIIQKD